MASRIEFVEFAIDQMGLAGSITYRKMFGDYGVYCDGKFFALICDDQLFIKITDPVLNKYPKLQQAPPYDGAKKHFLIEDLDDRQWLSDFVSMTCQALPIPKPKKQTPLKR